MSNGPIYCGALHDGVQIMSISGLRGLLKNDPDNITFHEIGTTPARTLSVSDLTPNVSVIVSGPHHPEGWKAIVLLRDGKVSIA